MSKHFPTSDFDDLRQPHEPLSSLHSNPFNILSAIHGIHTAVAFHAFHGYVVFVMSIVFEGVVKADGTLELQGRPKLPPGRVRVTLELAARSSNASECLPDPPWLDEGIPTPFDLPLPGRPQPIEPFTVEEFLPAPFEWTEDSVRP